MTAIIYYTNQRVRERGAKACSVDMMNQFKCHQLWTDIEISVFLLNGQQNLLSGRGTQKFPRIDTIQD